MGVIAADDPHAVNSGIVIITDDSAEWALWRWAFR
jgi:hypothetical protein